MQRASLYRRRLLSVPFALLMAWLLGCAAAHAAQAPDAAPELLARAADGSVETLPLQSTRAEVQITGAIAEVRLVQVYGNRGTQPIEAIYRFPASSTAAVHAASMRVGERLIQAQIRERHQARAEYEQARSEGRTASLLEQDHPSLFSLSVAQVQPGDRIEIDLRYTELLLPEDGEYRFVLPNALRPRYGSPGVATPGSSAPEVIDYSFDFDLRMSTPLPLAEFGSDSHLLEQIERHSHGGHWVLSADEAKAATRDLAVGFRLRGDGIGSGVLVDPDANGDGGWFLLMMEPPARAESAAILPREYIFVIDVSGSMTGPPLELSKRMMRNLLAGLRPMDRFNLVLFAGDSRVWSPQRSVEASAASVDAAMAFIDKQSAGGGTELVSALRTSYAMEVTPGMSRSVVVITDGAIWPKPDLYQTIRQQLDNANVFAFGVGGSLEREVIEAIARAGLGEPFMIDDFNQGQARAQRFREYIDSPLLTDVLVEGHEGTEIVDMEPDIVPDLMAQRPLVVLGRYRGSAAGEIAVSGLASGKPYEHRMALQTAARGEDRSVIRRLWAQRRVARLRDEQATTEGPEAVHSKEITELGLAHSLLTPYTAFVAVDQTVRNPNPTATDKTVQQPAPAAETTQAVEYAMVGQGNALTSLAGLAIHTATLSDSPAHETLWDEDRGVARSEMPAPGSYIVRRVNVGKRVFHVQADGLWRDSTHTESARLLRIRRGSAAYALLLKLSPELEAVLAQTGESVLLAFGETSIQIGPTGFSDYPEGTLRAALAGRRA